MSELERTRELRKELRQRVINECNTFREEINRVDCMMEVTQNDRSELGYVTIAFSDHPPNYTVNSIIEEIGNETDYTISSISFSNHELVVEHPEREELFQLQLEINSLRREEKEEEYEE